MKCEFNRQIPLNRQTDVGKYYVILHLDRSQIEEFVLRWLSNILNYAELAPPHKKKQCKSIKTRSCQLNQRKDIINNLNSLHFACQFLKLIILQSRARRVTVSIKDPNSRRGACQVKQGAKVEEV